jgi:hypothetical protein
VTLRVGPVDDFRQAGERAENARAALSYLTLSYVFFLGGVLAAAIALLAHALS